MVLHRDEVREQVKKDLGYPSIWLPEYNQGELDDYFNSVVWPYTASILASYLDVRAIKFASPDEKGRIWLNDLGITPEQLIGVFPRMIADKYIEILSQWAALSFLIYGSNIHLLLKMINVGELNKFRQSWDLRYEDRGSGLEPVVHISRSGLTVDLSSGSEIALVYNPTRYDGEVIWVPSGNLAQWVRDFCKAQMEARINRINAVYGQSVQLSVLNISLPNDTSSPEERIKALLEELPNLIPPPPPSRM